MASQAVIVGIDEYKTFRKLHGCVNDAHELAHLLRYNHDESGNFRVDETLNEDPADVTAGGIRKRLESLFRSRDLEKALFYFSGHGSVLSGNGYLCSADGQQFMPGIPFGEILGMANESRARHRFLILDCCHAGTIRDLVVAGGNAPLSEGVAILAASRGEQDAKERGGQGAFSALLCDGLRGGAADVRGFVSMAGIFSYIDELMIELDQRPLFLASLATFSFLRRSASAISDENLRRLTKFFMHKDFCLELDPSFEFTRPEAKENNVAVFRVLQQMRAARLVEPIGFDHMYDAAIEGGSCKLTPLGQFYWQKVELGSL